MAEVDNSAWDAGKAWAAGSNSDNPAQFFRGICAGEKTEGDPNTQAHWALPHHYHPGDAPNAAGVRNGLSRLPQTDGLKNKSAAQSHLESHMKAIQAADNRKSQRGYGLPGGQARMRGFQSEMRAKEVQRNGKSFYQVEGYATLFNKPYRMYDAFGEYTEQISSRALDQSLAGSPDVAFLLNHRGMTMARTTNGTLQLSKDSTGLKVSALLNADRADVRDMVSAINDGLIDEMSFAFMVDDGGFQWNDDYSALTLTRIDINRGDVSAVNYGANPYTSIAARAAELMELTDRMPADMARATALKLRDRFDFTEWALDADTGGDDDFGHDDGSDEPERAPEPEVGSSADIDQRSQKVGMKTDHLVKRYEQLWD